MLRARSHLLALLTIAPLCGCATQTQSPQAVTSSSPGECASRLASPQSESWQGVVAEGFSFCVPADWRRSGERSWEGSDGSVTWSIEPGSRPMEVVPFIAGVTRPPEVRKLVETIGGVRVEMRTVAFEQKHTGYAEWKGSPLRFSGSPTTRTAAQRYLEIFRTVRLTGRSSTAHYLLRTMTALLTAHGLRTGYCAQGGDCVADGQTPSRNRTQ